MINLTTNNNITDNNLHQYPIIKLENQDNDNNNNNINSYQKNYVTTPLMVTPNNISYNNINNNNKLTNIQKMNTFHSNHSYKFVDPPPSTSPSSSSSSMSSSSVFSSPSSSSLSSSLEDDKQWTNLMQEIDHACRLLGISADPYNWNQTEVRKWLMYQQRLHQLTQPMFNKLLDYFHMDGMSLCELSREDFHQRIYESTNTGSIISSSSQSSMTTATTWHCATILYNELNMWRTAISLHCNIEPDLAFFDSDPQFEQAQLITGENNQNQNYDQQQPQNHKLPVRSSMDPYVSPTSSPMSYGSVYQQQQQQQPQQMYQMDEFQAQHQQQMIQLYNPSCNSAFSSSPPSPAGSSHSSMMMSPNHHHHPTQQQSSVNHVAYTTNDNNNHHQHLNHDKFNYPIQQQQQQQNATRPDGHHNNNGNGYLYDAAMFSQQQQNRMINNNCSTTTFMMQQQQQTSDYGSDCCILSDDDMSDDSVCESINPHQQNYLHQRHQQHGFMMKFDSLPSLQPQQQINTANAVNRVTSPATTVSSASVVQRPHGSTSIQLWQFLKELLSQPQSYGTSIRWLERSKGVFKIEDSVRVAKLWGERKKRPAMNYDKLSRSIRQYYKKGIMKKTERAQRLVYQFCQPYGA